MNSSKSTNHLLILRGLAIVGILISHVQYPQVSVPLLSAYNLSWITSSNGAMFVWIWFILSGYLIGKGFFSNRYTLTVKGITTYVINKVLRIAPAYYLVAILCYAVFHIWLTDSPENGLLKVLTFTSTDLFYRLDVGYLWTTSAIMQWYVVAPIAFLVVLLLKRMFKQWKHWPIILTVVVICGGYALRVYEYLKLDPQWVWQYLNAMHTKYIYNLYFFLFGFLLNFFMVSKNSSVDEASPGSKISNSVLTITKTIAVAALYVFGSYITYIVLIDPTKNLYYLAILLPLCTLFVTGFYIYVTEKHAYSFSYEASIHQDKRIHFARPLSILQWIGVISYELYLVHYPIMMSFSLHCNRLNENGCQFGQFIQRLGLLLILSVLSAWLLQKYSKIVTKITRGLLRIGGLTFS